MLGNSKCWTIKQVQGYKMSMTEMKILRWMCHKTRRDMMTSEYVIESLRVPSIEDKAMDNQLR